MNDYNPKMGKRLSWIHEKNQEQALWIRTHISSKKKKDPSLGFPDSETRYIGEYISKFINLANGWPETSESREFCRNLKAAWNMYIKRKNNKKMVEGSYSISTKARKKLESLAKRDNSSLSNIIEGLITDSGSINKRDIELNNQHTAPQQVSDLVEIANLLDNLKSRDKELVSAHQDLELKDKELLLIQQKLENVEKELISTKNALKLSEEKLERNVNKSDQETNRAQKLTLKRNTRSRVLKIKDV